MNVAVPDGVIKGRGAMSAPPPRRPKVGLLGLFCGEQRRLRGVGVHVMRVSEDVRLRPFSGTNVSDSRWKWADITPWIKGH